MVSKILGKATCPKKKKHVWLSGRLYIEGRLKKGRGFNESIIKTKNEAKQSKTSLHGVANNPARGLLKMEKMKKMKTSASAPPLVRRK